MSVVLNELLHLLQLETLNADLYVGQSQDLGWGRVYGGQVIAQAMVAANCTINASHPRTIHSLHSYFLRPGDTKEPIEYEVERVRDGASFSFRRVVARQKSQTIFVLSASYQASEEGLEHQFAKPDCAGPDGLLSELDLRRAQAHLIPERAREQFTCDRPFEIRPVEPNSIFQPEKRPPRKLTWVRSFGPMPDDLEINKCVLAYTSDWGLAGTSLQPHAMNTFTPKLQIVSLDHAMWFHRDFRMDDWLLYEQDSPSASQGRGLNRGHFFSRDGRLVASVAQEALIRLR